VAPEEGQWKITPEGTQWLIEETKRLIEEKKLKETPPPPRTGTELEPELNRYRTDTEPITELKGTVPSQIDILRSIGESLGVGTEKGGGIPLDAIVYYVERTANLDDLTFVWNRLTEMDVPDPVKKRW